MKFLLDKKSRTRRRLQDVRKARRMWPKDFTIVLPLGFCYIDCRGNLKIGSHKRRYRLCAKNRI